MNEIKEGMSAPDFLMQVDNGEEIKLSDFKGKKLVLYFYPKDDTPGCTTEAKDFTEHLAEFAANNASVIGVSKDNLKSHCKFKDKYNLQFPLAADLDGKACESYSCWVEKSMYGKKYMGIERSTFLIDGQGVVRKIWRKVSVTNHVKEVLEAVKELG